MPTEGTSGFGSDWYRNLIQFLLDGGHYVWFAKLIAIGELLIGVMLLLGVFTGIAALGGATMNWNYVLMGTASANPLIFLVGLLIVLGWRTAGYWGIDRWLLPALGTPWRPGKLFRIGDKLTEEPLHYQSSKEHPESS